MTRPVAVQILCFGGTDPFCVSGGCRWIIYFFLEKGPLERFSVDVKTNKRYDDVCFLKCNMDLLGVERKRVS